MSTEPGPRAPELSNCSPQADTHLFSVFFLLEITQQEMSVHSVAGCFLSWSSWPKGTAFSPLSACGTCSHHRGRGQLPAAPAPSLGRDLSSPPSPCPGPGQPSEWPGGRNPALCVTLGEGLSFLHRRLTHPEL